MKLFASPFSECIHVSSIQRIVECQMASTQPLLRCSQVPPSSDIFTLIVPKLCLWHASSRHRLTDQTEQTVPIRRSSLLNKRNLEEEKRKFSSIKHLQCVRLLIPAPTGESVRRLAASGPASAADGGTSVARRSVLPTVPSGCRRT